MYIYVQVRSLTVVVGSCEIHVFLCFTSANRKTVPEKSVLSRFQF